MFCSKCGTKIEEKDKFCPKCGHSIDRNSDDKQEAKEKKEDEKKESAPGSEEKPLTVVIQQPKNTGCLSCFYIFFIIIVLFSFIGALGYASTTKNDATGLIVGTLIFSFTFISLSIWGLIGLRRKNKQARENKTAAQVSNEDKTAAPIPDEKKKKSSDCLSVLAIFLIIVTLIGFFVWIGKKNKDKTDEPTTKTSGQNWDGNYNAKMTKPNCDSSVEFTSFQVSDNAVVNNWGKNAPIGTDGHATIIMDTGTVMTTDLTFTKDGVTGAWKTTRGCSGTLSATKSNSWF